MLIDSSTIILRFDEYGPYWIGRGILEEGKTCTTGDYYDREDHHLYDKLAVLAHEMWSGWMEYLFASSQTQPDGTVVIPKPLVDRWLRQMNTEFASLPEEEQDSDYDQADKIVFCIRYVLLNAERLDSWEENV